MHESKFNNVYFLILFYLFTILVIYLCRGVKLSCKLPTTFMLHISYFKIMIKTFGFCLLFEMIAKSFYGVELYVQKIRYRTDY